MASATDVITYIGVPLAVLGVLPILWNTAITLLALSKVKRTLRKSRLAGITRGDVINHVIEVELPRFTIAPLDREEQASLYWNIYSYPSGVQGGTWTIFNWKMHTIGLKTQRIEYVDQLRQPQADIGFEELVSYLLDLGAVPNPAGFRMLRTSGLWIPTGTALLLSPDQHDKCLTIAALDDSDGHLSLAVRWSKHWKLREKLSLPPYWIRIEGPSPKQIKLDMLKKNVPRDGDPLEEELSQQQLSPFDESKAESSNKNSSEEVSSPFNDTVSKDDPVPAYSKSGKTDDDRPVESIRCRLDIGGVLAAAVEHDGLITAQHLQTTHLAIRPSDFNTLGIWFASAATALGTSNASLLWNYDIPPATLTFSRKDTIPCGILVLLSIIPESSTPEWATQYDDEGERREVQMRRMREQSEEFMREGRMTAEQRAQNQMERHRKVSQQFFNDQRDRVRAEEKRTEQRMLEALQSPRWDNGLIGTHMLEWLKSEGYVCESYGRQRIVEAVLYKLLSDLKFAEKFREMLEAWRGWVENGGMRKADFVMLKENKVEFAYVSLLLAVVRDSVTAAEGSLAMDLQYATRVWKRVRLG
jgi:hypothetical protein